MMSSDASAQRQHGRSMMQIVESISTVAAPVALVTAMLGYIGWVRTRAFYSYFGLSPSLLAFSPQDYLLRSGEVSFGAVLVLILAGAVLLGLDRLLVRLLDGAGHWEKRVRWALAGLGTVLIFISLSGATTATKLATFPPIAGAVMLGLGAVLLLRFGAGSPGSVGLLSPAMVALAVVALGLSGFWAATTYARDLGIGAAKDVDRNPRNLRVVTVYSREPLDLPGTSITPSRLLNQEHQWNYRYTGARLLTYSNNRWFLIPQPGSSTYRPSVTILPDTDTIRVETIVPR